MWSIFSRAYLPSSFGELCVELCELCSTLWNSQNSVFAHFPIELFLAVGFRVLSESSRYKFS